jgi:hypothetical protein
MNCLMSFLFCCGIVPFICITTLDLEDRIYKLLQFPFAFVKLPKVHLLSGCHGSGVQEEGRALASFPCETFPRKEHADQHRSSYHHYTGNSDNYPLPPPPPPHAEDSGRTAYNHRSATADNCATYPRQPEERAPALPAKSRHSYDREFIIFISNI